jgi:bla regulator protein BlaR1
MMQGIVHHLWQSTLFAGAASLVALTLQANRALSRYWVWFAASAKFLIPFSLLIGLGAYIPHPVVASPFRTGWVAVVQELSQPLTLLPATEPAALWVHPVSDVDLVAAGSVVWACGFVAVAICWFLRWRRIDALRSSARAISVPTTLRIPVPVMAAPDLIEPGIVGIFRPVLLLPEGIADHLDRAHLDTILAHELCHVQRRDNLTAAIHMVVQAIFWFHPLTWWIGARLVAERERACDEEVLRLGCKANVYAESILVICRLYLSSPLACISGVTGSDLKRRIESIMSNRVGIRLGFARKAVLIAVGAAVVVVPVSVGIIDPPLIRAQSVDPPGTRFEVASIKPATNCNASGSIYGEPLSPSPGRLTLNCATVEGLILGAYSRYENGRTNFSLAPLVLGAPSWINSERYSISAKSAGQENRAIMNGPMLQALLQDRFKLKVNRQTRQIPVFALSVTRSGARLKPFQEGTCIPVDYAQDPAPQAPGQPPFCQNRIQSKAANQRAMHIPGATVTTFSALLGVILGRPVIDRTGINGRFDFDVDFAIDQSTPGFAPETTPTDPAVGVSVFTAVQEQLGLKLESTKGPGEVLVIDHVERPSDD